jgi:hypothetical protein
MKKRVHMATKKFYKPFVFVFLGIILGLSVFGSYKYSYTIKDYAVETSLQEMINHSDFIDNVNEKFTKNVTEIITNFVNQTYPEIP